MATDQEQQGEEEVIELPPIEFTAAGDSDAIQWVNLEKVKPTKGFPSLCFLMADALTNWVQTIVLNYNSKEVTVNFQNDGQWTSAQPMNRKNGDYLAVSLKQLSGMDFRQRHGVQTGKFQAKFLNLKFDCTVKTIGVKTGEQVIINVNIPRPTPSNFLEMGMRDKQTSQAREMFKPKSGLIIVSCLPGDGNSTLWQGIKAAGDRFSKDYFALEPKGCEEKDVENVTNHHYDLASQDGSQSYKNVLNDVILREPSALFLLDSSDPDRIEELLKHGEENEFIVVVPVVARNAAETPLRLLSMGLSPETVAKYLIGVVSSRLVRRLCDGCKQGYAPPHSMLKQLGIPVQPDMLFFDRFNAQEYTESTWDGRGEMELPPPCPVCNGSGFYGRTGLYEVVTMDEAMKKIISKGGKLSDMKQAIAAARNTTFKEEGIVKIVQGITSLDELQRVLKL